MTKPAATILNCFWLVASVMALWCVSCQACDGKAHETPAMPHSIVSLDPTLTEMLFFIGEGDKVVGVTRYCDYPDAVRNKTRVGDINSPDLELLALLRPDLVVTTPDNGPDLIGRLHELRMSVKTFKLGTDVDDVFSLAMKLIRYTGETPDARGRLDALKQRWNHLPARHHRWRNPPRIFIAIYGDTLFTTGTGTFLHSVIKETGAVNIAAERSGFFRLNLEDLITSDPDVIIVLASSGEEFASYRRNIEALPGAASLRAVRAGRIDYLDEDLVSRLGPRLVDGVEQLGDILAKEGRL